MTIDLIVPEVKYMSDSPQKGKNLQLFATLQKSYAFDYN